MLAKTSGSDEQTFLTNFYAQRDKVVNTNEYNQAPNGTNRVNEWRQMMSKGLFSLKNADAAVVQVTSWTMQ